MVHLLQAPARLTPHTCSQNCRVRAVRPSLLDARFVGDPWIVDHCDGTASVSLDDYPLTRLLLGVFDLPALNRVWTELRNRIAR
jgi:hypothetical protein